MSEPMDDHPNLLLDEWTTIRLDWHTTLQLAIQATTHQCSFQDMVEYALKRGLQYSQTIIHAYRVATHHAPTCTTMQTSIQATSHFAGLIPTHAH